MINYAITYEIWTEEDLEIGDTDDRGFMSESEWDSFSMMVELLQGSEPSQYPLPDEPDEYMWYTQSWDMNVYGEYENRSYHPASKRDARYMLKAWKYANRRNV